MIATLPSSLLAAIPVAIAAGFVSFVSPCVLPLLPGYLGFLSGSLGTVSVRRPGRTVLGAMAFILGFTLVFVSYGALFGELGNTLKTDQRTISIIFGVVTIVMGMLFAGWLPSAWLLRERRVHFLPSATVFGALLLGFFFGVGWSPCIGPTLAAVVGLASSSSGASAARGSTLAFFYCVGLGIPFIVFALFGEWATGTSKWLRRHQHTLAVVGGIMLIVVGVLEVTGLWAHFVIYLQDHLQVSLPL